MKWLTSLLLTRKISFCIDLVNIRAWMSSSGLDAQTPRRGLWLWDAITTMKS